MIRVLHQIGLGNHTRKAEARNDSTQELPNSPNLSPLPDLGMKGNSMNAQSRQQKYSVIVVHGRRHEGVGIQTLHVVSGWMLWACHYPFWMTILLSLPPFLWNFLLKTRVYQFGLRNFLWKNKSWRSNITIFLHLVFVSRYFLQQLYCIHIQMSQMFLLS